MEQTQQMEEEQGQLSMFTVYVFQMGKLAKLRMKSNQNNAS